MLCLSEPRPPETGMAKNKLYCVHSRKRGDHNTNNFFIAYKKDQTKDETAGGGGQRTNKDSMKKGKKQFACQTVLNNTVT